MMYFIFCLKSKNFILTWRFPPCLCMSWNILLKIRIFRRETDPSPFFFPQKTRKSLKSKNFILTWRFPPCLCMSWNILLKIRIFRRETDPSPFFFPQKTRKSLFSTFLFRDKVIWRRNLQATKK